MAEWDLRYFGFMITRDSVFAFVSNIVMHTCAGHQTLQGQGACWSRVCSNLTYWLLLYLSILKNLFLGSREFRFFFFSFCLPWWWMVKMGSTLTYCTLIHALTVSSVSGWTYTYRWWNWERSCNSNYNYDGNQQNILYRFQWTGFYQKGMLYACHYH